MTDQPTHTLRFTAKVVSIEEKKNKRWLFGVGEQAKFHEDSQGWYIGLERSHELLFAGFTRPPINPGDEAVVRINFYAQAPSLPTPPR